MDLSFISSSIDNFVIKSTVFDSIYNTNISEPLCKTVIPIIYKEYKEYLKSVLDKGKINPKYIDKVKGIIESPSVNLIDVSKTKWFLSRDESCLTAKKDEDHSLKDLCVYVMTDMFEKLSKDFKISDNITVNNDNYCISLNLDIKEAVDNHINNGISLQSNDHYLRQIIGNIIYKETTGTKAAIIDNNSLRHASYANNDNLTIMYSYNNGILTLSFTIFDSTNSLFGLVCLLDLLISKQYGIADFIINYVRK